MLEYRLTYIILAVGTSVNPERGGYVHMRYTCDSYADCLSRLKAIDVTKYTIIEVSITTVFKLEKP